MNRLLKGMMQRLLDHGRTPGDLAKLPAAYRNAGGSAGGGLLSRLATLGLLRLAFRWPTLAAIAIVSMVAARAISGRPPRHGAPQAR